MCLLDPSRIARISREAVVDTPDAVLPDCGGSQVAVQVLHHGTREGVDDAFAGRIVESDVFHTVGQPLCLYGLDDGIRRTGVADEELSMAEPSLRNTTSSRSAVGRSGSPPLSMVVAFAVSDQSESRLPTALTLAQ